MPKLRESLMIIAIFIQYDKLKSTVEVLSVAELAGKARNYCMGARHGGAARHTRHVKGRENANILRYLLKRVSSV